MAIPYVPVDIDRYMQRNDPLWRRLGDLARRGSTRVTRLSDDEIEELTSLYHRVSAQLSHARTAYADPDLNARLSQLLGEARSVIYRPRTRMSRAFGQFFTETFPAAVWGSRRYIAAAAVCLLVPAIGMGLWLANSPAALDASVPPEIQELIAQEQFESYYSSDAAQNFAGTVTVNNIQVAFLAFALGVVVLLGPGWILAINGLNIGVMAAVMHNAGEGALFWGLILPHGLLEISSVLVAGGAGLRVSWSLVAPGDRTRGAAFREEAARSVVVVMGLALCFIVAGSIEAFVTPSGLPTSLRIAVGVAALGAFAAYVVLLGSRAERRGLTGLLNERSRDEFAAAEADAARATMITIR